MAKPDSRDQPSDEPLTPARRTTEPGFTQRLAALVDIVSASSPTRFEARISPVDDLFSADAETIILRIIEEGLRNVVQHARATESTLTVERQPASVIMTVQDNGQGFDANASERARQAEFGLDGLAQQVRILGGALSVASLPGEGTTLTIILDVPEPPDAEETPGADQA